MSTKIYTGIKIGVKTNKQLLNLMQSVKEQIVSATNELLAKDLAVYIANHEDRKCLVGAGYISGESQSADSSLVSAKLSFLHAMKVHDLESNYTSEIQIFVDSIGKTYGMYFIPHGMSSSVILNFPPISDFRYWNNTDRPDDISQSVWDRRGDKWNQMLGRCWSKYESCLVYHPVNKESLWELLYKLPEDKIFGFLPTIADRVSSTVNIRLFEIYKDRLIKSGKITELSFSTHGYTTVKRIKAQYEPCVTDEGLIIADDAESIRKEETQKVQKILRPYNSMNDLFPSNK